MSTPSIDNMVYVYSNTIVAETDSITILLVGATHYAETKQNINKTCIYIMEEYEDIKLNTIHYSATFPSQSKACKRRGEYRIWFSACIISFFLQKHHG